MPEQSEKPDPYGPPTEKEERTMQEAFLRLYHEQEPDLIWSLEDRDGNVTARMWPSGRLEWCDR
jgi:hypothetical protein